MSNGFLVLLGDYHTGLMLRRQGYEVRDSFYIPPNKTLFLVRGSSQAILSSSLRFSVGLRIEASRIGGLAGRWPANVLFQHSPTCVLCGKREVKAPPINRFVDGAKPFGNAVGYAYTSHCAGQMFEDVWACSPSCLVARLNDQSGSLVSKAQARDDIGENLNRDGWRFKRCGVQYEDVGGASKFFYGAATFEELFAYLQRLVGNE